MTYCQSEDNAQSWNTSSGHQNRQLVQPPLDRTRLFPQGNELHIEKHFPMVWIILCRHLIFSWAVNGFQQLKPGPKQWRQQNRDTERGLWACLERPENPAHLHWGDGSGSEVIATKTWEPEFGSTAPMCKLPGMGTSEAQHQVKGLAANPGDLNLNPWIHKGEGKLTP